MNQMDKPLILVSNDDGYQAKGVRELVKCLAKIGTVIAVCPDAPRSAQSMAITVAQALRITRAETPADGVEMWKVNGTPADCVKLAMHTIMDRMPDLVVAGINHGSNASINVLYSGTMGAVMEGCAFGVPSIGFSLTSHDADADFNGCLPFVERIVKGVLRDGLPEGVALNVNIPATNPYPEKMQFCRECKGKWTDEYQEYVDPHGEKFYWLKGNFINEEPDSTDTDEWALRHGIVSIVAENLERTARNSLPPLFLMES